MAAAHPDGPRGRLITVEGVEGAGKSTQVERLRAWLAERGVPVVLTAEPDGTPLGARLRRVLGEVDRVAPADRGASLRREPRGARPASDPAGARRRAGRPLRPLRRFDRRLPGIRPGRPARDHRPAEPPRHRRRRAGSDARPGSRRGRGAAPRAGPAGRAGRLRPLRAARASSSTSGSARGTGRSGTGSPTGSPWSMRTAPRRWSPRTIAGARRPPARPRAAVTRRRGRGLGRDRGAAGGARAPPARHRPGPAGACVRLRRPVGRRAAAHRRRLRPGRPLSGPRAVAPARSAGGWRGPVPRLSDARADAAAGEPEGDADDPDRADPRAGATAALAPLEGAAQGVRPGRRRAHDAPDRAGAPQDPGGAAAPDPSGADRREPARLAADGPLALSARAVRAARRGRRRCRGSSRAAGSAGGARAARAPGAGPARARAGGRTSRRSGPAGRRRSRSLAEPPRGWVSRFDATATTARRWRPTSSSTGRGTGMSSASPRAASPALLVHADREVALRRAGRPHAGPGPDGCPRACEGGLAGPRRQLEPPPRPRDRVARPGQSAA